MIDGLIIFFYLAFVLFLGWKFSDKNQNIEDYSVSKGKIPTWALGLSFYATFLSAITFLGDPGRSFMTNWNAFAFSLSIPFAAYFANNYFIPFYKSQSSPSAYGHLEKRFGRWATIYPMVCFILTQLARMGTIFFAMSLVIHRFTNWNIEVIMIIIAGTIIFYSFLGGIRAIIWTEVAQSIIKTLGAIIILAIIFTKVDFNQIIDIAKENNKFSLGSFDLDFGKSSFWTVFLYGFFINLTNFGVDQNYIQRYHTAPNNQEAAKSVWAVAYYYIPVSFLFFFIGTSLYGYYSVNPDELIALKQEYGADGIGDKVLPDFIQNHVPMGFKGLIIAALLSAGMSAISNGINSSATIIMNDFVRNKFNSPEKKLKAIRLISLIIGLMGLGFGLLMIGIKSILETWWILSGIFASGMLGLFLLAIMNKNIGPRTAIISTLVGIISVVYLSIQSFLPKECQFSLDPKLSIVAGTVLMVLIGKFISMLFKGKNKLKR